MWNKKIWIGLLAVSASMAGTTFGDEAKDQAAVAKLLPTAKVTLSQGLAAAESKGQPICLFQRYLTLHAYTCIVTPEVAA